VNQGHIKIECPNLNKDKSADLKKKASPRKDVLTLLGEIKIIQQVAHHKKEVRKPTCASWLDLSHPPQTKFSRQK